MGFALRDDVYYCIANRKVVMLDLRSNALFCLPAATDAAFQQLAENAPLTEGSTGELAPLISRGFLVEAKGDGLLAPRPHPLVPLRDVPAGPVLEVRLADTLAAIFCQLFTICDLRVRPIHTILAGLRKRKASAIRQADPFMDDHARRALATMLATRRLIATQDKCLRWSIAMARYLARYGAYPKLVFGIRMQPFGAHAWIQADDVVLNDSADHASQYAPILVI